MSQTHQQQSHPPSDFKDFKNNIFSRKLERRNVEFIWRHAIIFVSVKFADFMSCQFVSYQVTGFCTMLCSLNFSDPPIFTERQRSGKGNAFSRVCLLPGGPCTAPFHPPMQGSGPAPSSCMVPKLCLQTRSNLFTMNCGESRIFR